MLTENTNQDGDSSMLDYSYDLVFRVALDGRVVFTNRPFRESMKLDSDGSHKRNVQSFFVLDCHEELKSCLETSRSGIPLKGAMLTLQMSDGKRIHVTASFVPEDEGSVLVFCRSIREQEAAREAQRQSEKQLLTVLSNLPDLLLVIDRDGNYRQVHTADESLLLRPSEELIGKRVFDVMPQKDADEGMEIIANVIATQQPLTLEYDLELKGQRKWFSAKVVPFSVDQEMCVLWVSRDITDLVHGREKQASNEKLLRSLLELEMQAREVVAYEIHDGLVQHAIGAQMWLQSVKENLTSNPEKATSSLDVALDSIGQCVDDARAMIRDLRPVVFQDQGLLVGLSQLVRVMQKKTGIPLRFLCDQPPPLMLDLLEAQIFRIVQESLNNVIRHSGATEATVWLHGDEDKLHVEITDNGSGFDPDTVDAGRYGLEGISRRASVFGGKFELDSESGLGTRIRISFPVIPSDTKSEESVPRDSIK